MRQTTILLGVTIKKKKLQKVPDLELEELAQSRGYNLVAGVDEAGRGPWAGPVVAGAVVLHAENTSALLRTGLDDSKKLSTRPLAY